MFPAPFQNLRVSYVNEIYSWYCRVQYIIIDCQSGNEGLRRVRYSSCEELSLQCSLSWTWETQLDMQPYRIISGDYFPPFPTEAFPKSFQAIMSSSILPIWVLNTLTMDTEEFYKNNNQIF